MFYDPTPPLSSSWSEWPGRFNTPGHYDEEDWGGQSRSFSNPRLRRYDFMDDGPRMSRTNSRTDSTEMNSEGDDSPEQETTNRPPRVHRIPIFVEERQCSQDSTESPDTPDSAEDIRKEWEASHGNNTVPRFRRRNFGSEDDLQRSRSHTSAFQRARAQDVGEPQPQPRRRRQNVTTVKINCDDDALQPNQQQKQQQQQPVDPKREQLSVIENVVKEVEELKKQVETVSGKEDKHVRYLDEMLTRCMLKLDNVNTMGEEDIRLARKSAICNVQSCIDLLESKLHPPPPKKDDMKSPQVTDKQVIVLPFYTNEPDAKEVTSSPEADAGNGQNGAGKTDKNVIVLPYNQSEAENPKSPKKTVIVLPYHDVTENQGKNDSEVNTESEGQKTPEKTVIVLPYHEKSMDKVENGIIALPFYETADNDSKDDENVCTKL